MARKQTHAAHENHERWLVSYADLMTLMFAFFVVMFASSQTDKGRAKQVSDSVESALASGGMTAAVREVLGGTVDEKGKGNAMMKGPGGSNKSTAPNSKTVAELAPSMQFLTKELQSEIKTGKIELRLEARGLVVSLRQAAFFPSGEDTIDVKTFPTMDKIASTIKGLPNSVRLEGHTDSVPIHTARYRSNWELSAARAIAMLELLTTRYGVPRERFAIAGYAETVPVGSNETNEGRAHNRRVDVVILNQRVVIPEPSAQRSPSAPQGAPQSAPQSASHEEKKH